MGAAEPAGKLTRKDFVSDQDVRWCPGCGDYAVLAQVQKVMPELNVPRENVVFVSGIGCSSRFPYYMNTYGFHSIHGRAPAIASGIKLSRPELSVWIVTGDGDGLSIGGNHLIHILRRNLDVNILLFNNRIYGLTKGQFSPTSHVGQITKSSPDGVIDNPFDAASLAFGAGATFVARTVDVEQKHLQEVLHRAAAHKGTSFIEILQNCPVFNDGTFSAVTDGASRIDNQLVVEHGKPLTFGEGGKLGIRLTKEMTPEVVSVADVGESAILVHDEANESMGYFLTRLAGGSNFPVPLGVLHCVERPTYESMLYAQIEDAKAKAGGTQDFDKLFASGDTWVVQ
ncbi:MAG: 2-oxoacid:ferredoxin oxidoreductase subunit beta [Deltaproteobacteria bacterium]